MYGLYISYASRLKASRVNSGQVKLVKIYNILYKTRLQFYTTLHNYFFMCLLIFLPICMPVWHPQPSYPIRFLDCISEAFEYPKRQSRVTNYTWVTEIRVMSICLTLSSIDPCGCKLLLEPNFKNSCCYYCFVNWVFHYFWTLRMLSPFWHFWQKTI